MSEPTTETRAESRAKLEARGYVVYDHPGDWLGLSEAEKRLIDLEIAATRAVKSQREALGLSQADLAARLDTTERHVAKLEVGLRGFSFDAAIYALLAMGGDVRLVVTPPAPGGELPPPLPLPKPRRKPVRPAATPARAAGGS